MGQRNYDAEVIRENDLNKLYTLRAVQLASVIAETVSIDTKSRTFLGGMSEDVSYTIDQSKRLEETCGSYSCRKLFANVWIVVALNALGKYTLMFRR